MQRERIDADSSSVHVYSIRTLLLLFTNLTRRSASDRAISVIADAARKFRLKCNKQDALKNGNLIMCEKGAGGKATATQPWHASVHPLHEHENEGSNLTNAHLYSARDSRAKKPSPARAGGKASRGEKKAWARRSQSNGTNENPQSYLLWAHDAYLPTHIFRLTIGHGGV